MITPLIGFKGPGAQMPMPSYFGRLLNFASNDSMAWLTASRPACGFPSAIMGLRLCARISPAASTSPTATFVPPISTPRASLDSGPIFVRSLRFWMSRSLCLAIVSGAVNRADGLVRLLEHFTLTLKRHRKVKTEVIAAQGEIWLRGVDSNHHSQIQSLTEIL